MGNEHSIVDDTHKVLASKWHFYEFQGSEVVFYMGVNRDYTGSFPVDNEGRITGKPEILVKGVETHATPYVIVGPSETVPLVPYKTPKFCDLGLNFDTIITFGVCKYFVREYDEFPGVVHYFKDQIRCKVRDVVYTVTRRNHGLPHGIDVKLEIVKNFPTFNLQRSGLRQGFLALDILKLLLFPWPTQLCTAAQNLVAWISDKKSQTRHFSEKVQLAASCQRIGRRSETGQSVSKDIYMKYEHMDTVYFQEIVEQTPAGKIFLEKSESGIALNQQEVTFFRESLRWATAPQQEEQDLKNLRSILHCAHQLDLRRTASYDMDRVQRDAALILFGEAGEFEKDFIGKIFDFSGGYLSVCGDRDGVLGKAYYDDYFAELCNEPANLAALLRTEHEKHWERVTVLQKKPSQ